MDSSLTPPLVSIREWEHGVFLNPMRRILTIALAVLFGYTLIAPALALDGSSQLPACCRPHGQHHCSMMRSSGAGLASRERQLDARHPRCPLFPHATVVTHAVAFAPADAAFFAGMVPRPAIISSIEASGRISAARSHQKRGPPATRPL